MSKHIIVLLIGCLFINSCSRLEIKDGTEKTILTTLNKIRKNNSELISYYKKNPVKIYYNSDRNLKCSLYDFKNSIIYIPLQFESSPLTLELELVKALNIWKMHNSYSLNDITLEELILGDMASLKYFISNNPVNDFFNDKILSNYIKNIFCNFILINFKTTLNLIHDKYIAINTKCLYPPDTINEQKIWLNKMQQAIADGTYIDFVYESDLEKVKKGFIRMQDANRNALILRSKNMYEIYREQRGYINMSLKNLDRFEKFYNKETENWLKWEKDNKKYIEKLKYEFTSCGS